MDQERMLQVSKELLQEYRTSFTIFDEDGDGRVTKEELRIAMRRLGQNPTEQDLDEMFAEVDTNGSGTIEFDEFVAMMKKRISDVDEESEMRNAFRVFDKDGDGYIGRDELKDVMLSMGEDMSDKDVQKMFAEVDLNSDGRIDYEEFVKMMTTK